MICLSFLQEATFETIARALRNPGRDGGDGPRGMEDLNPNLSAAQALILETMIGVVHDSLEMDGDDVMITEPQEVQQRLTELAEEIVDDGEVFEFVQHVIDLLAREEAGEWFFRGDDALDMVRQYVMEFFQPELPDGFEFLAEWYGDMVRVPLSPVCR